MSRNFGRGFTLIELAVVVAIVGILATVAVPVYVKYVIRARVSEGFVFGDQVMLSVAERFQTRGDAPDAGTPAALAAIYAFTFAPTDDVASIMVTNSGQVTVTYANSGWLGSAANSTLVLVPTIAGVALVPNAPGPMRWDCYANGATASINGRTAVGPAVPPTLPMEFAPANCR